jgi:hypothetical protein
MLILAVPLFAAQVPMQKAQEAAIVVDTNPSSHGLIVQRDGSLEMQAFALSALSAAQQNWTEGAAFKIIAPNPGSSGSSANDPMLSSNNAMTAFTTEKKVVANPNRASKQFAW